MYIGIVAEWNPFHEGHAHLLSMIRARYPEAPIAAAMSGAFVQRGEPALFDKWSRAAWSVEHGVSAAAELPVSCVLQSADRFAEAGILLLHAMGCTHAAFGAETLDAAAISAIAEWTFSPAFSEAFHEALRKGLPYSAAVNDAAVRKFPGLADDLTKPNNLLGIQYARTILQYDLPMEILPFPRDQAHPVSATAIRGEIAGGRTPSHIPEAERPALLRLLRSGAFTDYRRYDDACLLSFRLLTKEHLIRSGLFSEGLENRWLKEMQRTSYEDMLAAIKSRRYLYSRLRRIGASLLLAGADGPAPMAQPGRPLYVRLLALRRTESALLRRARLPVITSTARAERTLSGEAAAQLALDRRACDIQTFCFHGSEQRAGRQDYYRSPVIL